MNHQDIIDKLGFVVYGENNWRVKILPSADDELRIQYDAHGQTVSEATQTIRNIVNLARVPIWLSIVHGYNKGTAIKDELAQMNFYGKVTYRYTPDYNEGETILRVAE